MCGSDSRKLISLCVQNPQEEERWDSAAMWMFVETMWIIRACVCNKAAEMSEAELERETLHRQIMRAGGGQKP